MLLKENMSFVCQTFERPCMCLRNNAEEAPTCTVYAGTNTDTKLNRYAHYRLVLRELSRRQFVSSIVHNSSTRVNLSQTFPRFSYVGVSFVQCVQCRLLGISIGTIGLTQVIAKAGPDGETQ